MGQGFHSQLINLSYREVFWIDASSEESAKRGLTEVMKSVEKAKEMSYENAKLWFNDSGNPWLLILDTVDNPTIDYPVYLPEQ